MVEIDQVVIFNALERSPTLSGTERHVERVADHVQVYISLSARRGRAEGTSDGLSQDVAISGVESHPKRRRGYPLPTICRVTPVFRNLYCLRLLSAECVGEVLRKKPSTVPVDLRDLIEPQAVEVAFRKQELSVVDEELTDFMTVTEGTSARYIDRIQNKLLVSSPSACKS